MPEDPEILWVVFQAALNVVLPDGKKFDNWPPLSSGRSCRSNICADSGRRLVWQNEPERCSATLAALDLNASAVKLEDVRDKGSTLSRFPAYALRSVRGRRAASGREGLFLRRRSPDRSLR